MKRKVLTTFGMLALITAVVVMCPATSYAQGPSPQSTTFDVTATVAAACSVSATNVAFGVYVPVGGPALDATGTITITCTSGTNATIALDNGANFLGTRRMASAGNRLGYGLFTDVAHTTPWGDGTNGTSTVAHTGTGAAAGLTVFGHLPAGQITAGAGAYSDTVTVTVTF